MNPFSGYKPACPVKHRALIDTVERMCKEQGITNIPEVHIAEGPGLAKYEFVIDQIRDPQFPMAATNGRKLYVSEGILKTLGSNAATHISRDMEAVIGHELCHFKEWGMHMGGKFLPIFALPAAAMAALYYIEKSSGTHEVNQDIMADIHKTDTEHDASAISGKAPTGQEDHELLRQILTVGKYLAVAALGTVVGYWVASKASNHFEYRSDVFGAKAAKDPQAMISALEKIHAKMNSLRPKVVGDLVAARKERASTFVGAVFETMHDIIESAEHMLDSHPNLAQRRDNIRRTAASTGASLF